MSGKYQQAGFHIISHDRLWQEKVHDAYKAKGNCLNPASVRNVVLYFIRGAGNGLKHLPERMRQLACLSPHT